MAVICYIYVTLTTVHCSLPCYVGLSILCRSSVSAKCHKACRKQLGTITFGLASSLQSSL